VVVTDGENGLFERAALDLYQKITQFVFGSQGPDSPCRTCVSADSVGVSPRICCMPVRSLSGLVHIVLGSLVKLIGFRLNDLRSRIGRVGQVS